MLTDTRYTCAKCPEVFGYDEKIDHMGEVHQERIFIECPKKCEFRDADGEQMREHLLSRCPNVLKEEESGERDPEVDYEDPIQKVNKIDDEELQMQEVLRLQEQQILQQFGGGFGGEVFGDFGVAPAGGG